MFGNRRHWVSWNSLMQKIENTGVYCFHIEHKTRQLNGLKKFRNL